MEIAKDVSVGGALSFLSGNYSYELSLDADDTKNLDLEWTGFSYRDTIESDSFGVDGKIGLMARPIDQIKLGATISIPLDFSVDEHWTQRSFYSYDDGTSESESDEGDFAYDISRPVRSGAGIAFCPIPGAIIAGDVLYTDWTQTEYSEPPSEDVSNEDFIEDYRSTFQLRFGTEYTIPGLGLSLRAGYMLDPLPHMPEGTNIETDRKFLTLGVGMMLADVLSLDVAYMRGSWKESSNGGDIDKARSSNRIFLSTVYKF